MYLVDTNVLSAGAPTKGVTSVEWAAWMDAGSSQLYLSAVTVAEICDGITKLRREGATRKADGLTDWLETVLHLYGDRILGFDVAVARLAGALSDRARGAGHALGGEEAHAVTFQHHAGEIAAHHRTRKIKKTTAATNSNAPKPSGSASRCSRSTAKLKPRRWGAPRPAAG